jgi:hypothetical protein
MGLNWLTNRWALDHAGDIEPAANNTYSLGVSNFWASSSIVNMYSYVLKMWGPTFLANLSANSAATGTQTLVLPATTSDTLVGRDSVDNLTNKRIKPRVISSASASSLTPDQSAADLYAFTALAANLTINAPINLLDGERLDFRIRDNGTSKTLTWNAAFRIIGTTLPTATVANKTVYVRTIYNAADTVCDVIDVNQQA